MLEGKTCWKVRAYFLPRLGRVGFVKILLVQLEQSIVLRVDVVFVLEVHLFPIVDVGFVDESWKLWKNGLKYHEIFANFLVFSGQGGLLSRPWKNLINISPFFKFQNQIWTYLSCTRYNWSACTRCNQRSVSFEHIFLALWFSGKPHRHPSTVLLSTSFSGMGPRGASVQKKIFNFVL